MLKNKHMRTSDSMTDKRLAAIQSRMNMRSDGTPHLDIINILKYGSARQRVEARITRARVSCARILEELDGFDENEFESKDTLLVQEFVLEHFTFIKRLGLSKEFFGFNGTMFPFVSVKNMFLFNKYHSYVVLSLELLPGTVDPISWFISWGYVWGIMGFCFYWILVWGVKVGPEVIKAWGSLFLMAALQVF